MTMPAPSEALHFAAPLQTTKRALFSRLRVQLLVVLMVQLVGIYVPLLMPLSVTELRLANAWIPIVYTTAAMAAMLDQMTVV